MMNFKSGFLQELQSRGFVAQITHEKELDDALFFAEQSYKNSGESLKGSERFSAYIGFDCTASSLHVGSLIQIMILRLLQKHGHEPIALLGGGTTKIGDPSGKDESRQILTEEKIQQNLDGIKNTLAKFILFDENEKDACDIFKNNNPEALLNKVRAKLVNNNDWLKNINYIEFLRDVGKHFSVNRMLTFDSVKTRLERDQPLSFLEFNYMILQAYDFYELNKEYGCRLQIGGSDQWGNIVNGVELTRRVAAASFLEKRGAIIDSATNLRDVKIGEVKTNAFGLTSPLLTTSDGKKMGKTADGAVWLDSSMLAPFDYFQYFRNTHDADVVKFLKLFTDLSLEEIVELEKLKDQEINKAKEILAFEVTKICHGEKIANEVLQKAREIFIAKNSTAYETKEISISEGKKLIEIIKEIGATESNAEAKRLIEGRGVKINDQAVTDINHFIKNAEEFNLSVGKKKFFRIIAK
jgi:tyrosyl-tRNA synthetase